MSISEGVQLTIQAAALGHRGEVFVLDMGLPVRIVDLASRMIRLMGSTVRDDRNPDGEVQIAYTGLRPGEKLHDEYRLPDNIANTEHPRILRANEQYVPWSKLAKDLMLLRRAIGQNNAQTVHEILMRCVPDYSPSGDRGDVLQSQLDGDGTLESIGSVDRFPGVAHLQVVGGRGA